MIMGPDQKAALETPAGIGPTAQAPENPPRIPPTYTGPGKFNSHKEMALIAGVTVGIAIAAVAAAFLMGWMDPSDEALLAAAVAEKDPENCGKIREAHAAANCYIDVAITAGDIGICDMIKDNGMYRLNCYIKTGVSDASLCQSLSGEGRGGVSNKDLCLVEAAINSGDSSACTGSCAEALVKRIYSNSVKEGICERIIALGEMAASRYHGMPGYKVVTETEVLSMGGGIYHYICRSGRTSATSKVNIRMMTATPPEMEIGLGSLFD